MRESQERKLFKKCEDLMRGVGELTKKKKRKKEETTKPMRESPERTPFLRFIRRMRAE